MNPTKKEIAARILAHAQRRHIDGATVSRQDAASRTEDLAERLGVDDDHLAAAAVDSGDKEIIRIARHVRDVRYYLTEAAERQVATLLAAEIDALQPGQALVRDVHSLDGAPTERDFVVARDDDGDLIWGHLSPSAWGLRPARGEWVRGLVEAAQHIVEWWLHGVAIEDCLGQDSTALAAVPLAG